MASLTVWKFDTPDEAGQALERLKELQKQELIKVADAAVVSWPQDRKGPVTRQGMPTVGVGAIGGGFWGLLFGLIFFMPLLGLAVGAAAGAIGGALTDYGINDDFIKQTREKVTRGTSALFLLSQTQAPDKVADELQDLDPELIATNLSREQEDKLRELFGDDPTVGGGPAIG